MQKFDSQLQLLPSTTNKTSDHLNHGVHCTTSFCGPEISNLLIPAPRVPLSWLDFLLLANHGLDQRSLFSHRFSSSLRCFSLLKDYLTKLSTQVFVIVIRELCALNQSFSCVSLFCVLHPVKRLFGFVVFFTCLKAC